MTTHRGASQEIAVALRDEGLTQREIAEIMQVTHWYVGDLLTGRQWVKKDSPTKKARKRVRDTAASYALAEQRVDRCRARLVDAVNAALDLGLTHRELAESTGLTRQAVTKYAGEARRAEAS